MANRLFEYVKESREELKKVLWPSRPEVVNHTLLVIGISVVVALFIAGVDYVLNLLLQQVI